MFLFLELAEFAHVVLLLGVLTLRRISTTLFATEGTAAEYKVSLALLFDFSTLCTLERLISRSCSFF